nr:helix-turn-helix transcriptional regulator [Bradyrhizobium sp. 139]
MRRKLTKGGPGARPVISRHNRREACTRISEVSGFTQQYISDLERGRRNPTVVTLFELVDLVLPDEEFCKEQTKTPKQK